MSNEARAELIISFINVGDGDAILIRRLGGENFALLIDAGRENVCPAPDSSRGSCGEFLREMGISRLDAVIVTHLHEDHAGGLGGVMDAASIDTVYSAYFPAVSGPCAEEPAAVKTVQGLIACLNKWARDVGELKRRGARLVCVDRTVTLAVTKSLRAQIIVRDELSAAWQNEVYDKMLNGDALSQEQKIDASKLRNPNSLRVRLYFAGREVELAGDCYGCLWENAAQSCDLFKVPHHGDRKALTPALVNALKPRDAVISCAREYMPEKDRPSPQTAKILREAGARVWYVDSYADDGKRAAARKSLDFIITADGRVKPNV